MKEKLDSKFMGMLHEDRSAPANLPQEKMCKYYPKNEMADNYYLDDSIRGVDENIDNSVRKIREHQSDSMY